MNRFLDLVERKIAIWLLLGAFAVFLLLLTMSLGLYPVVFADEYVYGKYARLAPIAESPVPTYIYSLIYRTTNICGGGFLSCTRVLNALFFVSAAPFIYLVARLVVGRLPALMVALLAISTPAGSYSAYFMPETIYFLVFWMFTALLLTQRALPPILHHTLCGVSLGILSLIKPHALLILPAITLYIAYAGWRGRAGWPTSILKNAAILLAAVTVTKFGLSYVIAGKTGLTFLGPTYSTQAALPKTDFHHLLSFAVLAADSARGHLLGMSLLFGLPLAVSILSFREDVFTDRGRRARLRSISFFFLSLLLNLIFVTAVFTASVAGSNPYEDIARLHVRYYNFLFPLLLIIAAAYATAVDRAPHFCRIATAVSFCAIIAYSLVTHLDKFAPSFVDAPELRGMSANRTAFWIIGALSFASLALWAWRGRPGARVFFFVYMPLCTMVSWYFLLKDLRPRMVPDVYDRAGIFAQQFLPAPERDKLVVVGENLGAVLRTMFLVDSRLVSLQWTSPAEPDQKPKLPADAHWVLTFGDSPPTLDGFAQWQMPGFLLTRLMTDLTVDFASPPSLGVLKTTMGLSGPEAGGAWSIGKLVTLQFVGPLPGHFTLRLVAHAFGPNVGQRVVLRVGDSAAEFELGAATEVREFELRNPAGSSTLTIEVPSPTSPSELGVGNDQRKLGLKLFGITVVPLPRPTSR